VLLIFATKASWLATPEDDTFGDPDAEVLKSMLPAHEPVTITLFEASVVIDQMFSPGPLLPPPPLPPNCRAHT
jgi:hypothetical protein